MRQAPAGEEPAAFHAAFGACLAPLVARAAAGARAGDEELTAGALQALAVFLERGGGRISPEQIETLGPLFPLLSDLCSKADNDVREAAAIAACIASLAPRQELSVDPRTMEVYIPKMIDWLCWGASAALQDDAGRLAAKGLASSAADVLFALSQYDKPRASQAERKVRPQRRERERERVVRGGPGAGLRSD